MSPAQIMAVLESHGSDGRRKGTGQDMLAWAAMVQGGKGTIKGAPK